MKVALFVSLVLCATLVTAQTPQRSGQLYTFGATLAPQSPTDIRGVSGDIRVRTLGGSTLFYESNIFNGNQITAVHLHLTPQPGVIDGGPLVLALTNTSASVGLAPLSSSGNQPIFQIGNRTTTNLLANPQLAQARAGIIALGINDNRLENIGDIDRLLRQNYIYSDVHSIERPSPQAVVRGAQRPLPADQGRRLKLH